MQNYKNHRRFHPVFHFVLTPLLIFTFIYMIVRLVQEPGFDRAVGVLLVLIVYGVLATQPTTKDYSSAVLSLVATVLTYIGGRSVTIQALPGRRR